MLFVGVEGGATHSTGVVVDEKGKELATAQGLDTNVWIIGVDELINRIESLIVDLIQKLGASEGTVFDAIGLSISGGSQTKMAERIKQALKASLNYKLGDKYRINRNGAAISTRHAPSTQTRWAPSSHALTRALC